MKTFKILFFMLLLSFELNTIAQVAISTDGSFPDSSAMLDIKSTNKGLLLPRLNTIQISYITNPAAGLLLFNTDSLDFYGFNGNVWVSIWDANDTINNWVCGNTFTDMRDNKVYNTVRIGTQCWMAENLNVGTRIDGNINQTQNTPTEIIEKYCYNDDINNCNTYGGIYRWNEMMQYVTTEGVQGICPDGWHLPTDDEWKILEIELGMTQAQSDSIGFRGNDEGEKMKSTSGWNNNGNGTNSSGLNVYPGGFLFVLGWFYGSPYVSYIWTSTQVPTDTTLSYYREFAWTENRVRRTFIYNNDDYGGNSVRCIKD